MSEEINYTSQIPNGWAIIAFNHTCESISLNGIKIKQKQYLNHGKFPVIDQGQDLIGGYFNDDKLVVSGKPPYVVFGDHTRVKKYVNFDFIAGADGVKVLKPFNFYNPKLFYHFLHCIKLPDKGYARHFQFLQKAEFPLPPLAEQQRIVDKIEELFASLDKGIEDLKTAQQQLKVYRQAVLKYAFEGALTKSWIESKPIKYNTQELLDSIKREKDRKVQAGKIRSNVAPAISNDELLLLPKISKSMCWVRLGDILWSVKDGPHYSPKYQPSGIPFISGGNIRPHGIDFKNVKYISKELHEELSKRCRPEKGDVLYSKGGTTGIARVNSYDLEFNVWVHVAVLKPVTYINPSYLQHALNSQHCYKQAQKYTHGVGNQDLGLTRMILITLPICSLEEQDRIVQEIESRLSVCDKIEESIEQSLQQAEALRQSILKRAFEGKLVPQDPNDEPASVLLERIKAERAQNKSFEKSKRNKKQVNLKADL